MAQMADPPNLDVDYWRHRLETHQWTAQEMEAYRAGRLAGRLESALQKVEDKRYVQRGALHVALAAAPDDLYAQGYEAGLSDASGGRLLVNCCTRCQDYTDGELAGLRRETKVVGALTLSSTGEITPLSWWKTVTPAERRLAVVLLRAYPVHATYPELEGVGGWGQTSGPDKHHILRINLTRLRPKLQSVGMRLVVAQNYGYRLEVDDATR